MDNRAEEFKTLTLLISSGNESLSKDVASSEQAPAAYIETHAAELQNRGIYEPAAELPWIALVDGLEKTGKLVELDWKETGEEFIKAIVKLSDGEESAEQIRGALSAVQTENSAKVSETLGRINQVLKPFDLSVIMIDIHADCYPLTLVPLASVASIVELADRIETERVHIFDN